MNKPTKQNKNVAVRCRIMAQKLWPRQRRRRLTDFPIDILERMVQMLPIYTVLILSETCTAFRDICLEQKRRAQCSYAEYLRYLKHKSPDSLEYWVCGWCSRLHRYSLSDEPANLWATNNCPQDPLSVFRARYHAGCRGYILRHHHVQYALKYTRFEAQGRIRLLKALPWDQAIQHVTSSQNRYIDRILRPYHATIWVSIFKRHLHTARYSAFPKIVEGVFLLKSTWTYDLRGPYGKSVRNGSLGHMVVCAHQFKTCRTVPEWVEEWKNTWKIIERYMSEQDQVMGDLWATWESTFGLPGYIDNILSHDDLMDRVFANQGTELSYSCAGCWTDFSIRATADDLIITAWQSLGGESAPLDATWRSLMVGKGPKGHLLGSSDRAHAPGSVRKMYSYSATSKLPAQ